MKISAFIVIVFSFVVFLTSQPALAAKDDKGVNCRQEIKELCGEVAQGEREACIRTHFAELSPACQERHSKPKPKKKGTGAKKKKKDK